MCSVLGRDDYLCVAGVLCVVGCGGCVRRGYLVLVVIRVFGGVGGSGMSGRMVLVDVLLVLFWWIGEFIL